MEKNFSEIVNAFNEIVVNAKKGEDTARRVAESLSKKAAELRSMADTLCALARTLTGSSAVSAGEPEGKKTVVLRTKDDEKAYKKMKKPAAPERKSNGWTPERRARQAEFMRRKQAEIKEKRALRAKLITAVEEA